MFKAARLKLTLLYLAIITLIVLFFSVVTYKLLVAEVDRFARFQRVRIEQRVHSDNNLSPSDFDLIQDTKNRIALGLLVVDGLIVFASGGLAYFLAGKTLQPIKEVMDDQRRFITDSSHELRTPLTSLKIATEVALRDKALSPSSAREILQDNLLEIDKLTRLSDDLLRLARYDSKANTGSFSKVSSAEIVKRALVSVAPLAKNKNIQIENNIKKFNFTGIESELVDLFVILLDNAIKYSPANTKISLKSAKSKKYLSFWISDQGVGVTKEDSSHIFERFYRSDKSRTGTAGFGLGLSIAKRIIDTHRGAIKVKQNLGGGSVFEIKLPLTNRT